MAKTERSYDLAPDELKALKAQYAETRQLPIPFNKGAYHYTIAALLSLDADEFHPLVKVHKAFEKIAGGEWYNAWANKPARTEHGKDAAGRFVQNLRVLQRTRHFAKPLLECGKKVLKSKGAVIDLARDEAGELLVRLNLNSAKPEKAV